MTPTERLVAFAEAEHRLPAQARADAERLHADTLAVGAAGATAPGADGVLAAARGWGAGDEARLIGSPDRLPAPSAAFVNGFRIHCLEWDAVHEPAVVHALSVVTAALGAAIDRGGGCDPDEALAALAVGVEVASALGVAATGPLRFFRPATAGCLGAALAVARIDRAPAADALGLAYGFAAGTMQAHVEGSIALPLQIANAARAAVTASDLARAGLTGPRDILEGPFGHLKLFDDGDLAPALADLGTRWRISDVSVKPYPCGRASHAVLGVLSALPDRAGVAGVEAHVPQLVARLVGRPYRPDMTIAYARLCLPLLAALMLRDGRVDPRAFTPDTFTDPALAALASRVTTSEDGNPDPNALSPQRAVVAYADGRREEVAVPHTLGSPQAPLFPEQAVAKRDLARALAPDADPRPFDDPLGWFTEPR